MANNPELLTRPLAEDGDKATIPDTTDGSTGIFSQQYGFQSINSLPLQAGGKAVRREDFNGAFNLLGGIAFYAQKGFTFNFNSTQEYFAGCVVIDTTDGKRYECIADVAAGGSVPSADSVHWQEFKLGGNGDGFEVGDIKIVAYNGTIPDKWFVCDGAAVSRDLYAKLYAKIGTTYGAGDGSTTFNLPNLVDKFVEGSTTAGTEKEAGLPNIEGSFNTKHSSSHTGTQNDVLNSQTGAFANGGVVTVPSQLYLSPSSASTTLMFRTTFNAAQSSAIYGASPTVQPPALTMRFFIKYEE